MSKIGFDYERNDVNTPAQLPSKIQYKILRCPHCRSSRLEYIQWWNGNAHTDAHPACYCQSCERIFRFPTKRYLDRARIKRHIKALQRMLDT